MNGQQKHSRFRKRPLLVAGLGIAVVSIAACGGFTSGNLMAPKCPDGGIDTTGNGCKPVVTDGGITDAGTGGDH